MATRWWEEDGRPKRKKRVTTRKRIQKYSSADRAMLTSAKRSGSGTAGSSVQSAPKRKRRGASPRSGRGRKVGR